MVDAIKIVLITDLGAAIAHVTPAIFLLDQLAWQLTIALLQMAAAIKPVHILVRGQAPATASLVT